MTGKDVLPEKGLLDKAATMKRFEYSPVGKELKAQTGIAKKWYQKLDNPYESKKILTKEKPSHKPNLIYDRKYSFYSYYSINIFYSLYLTPKYPILFSFYSELNKFNDLNPRKGCTHTKKTA